jgi:hypothetical protein
MHNNVPSSRSEWFGAKVSCYLAVAREAIRDITRSNSQFHATHNKTMDLPHNRNNAVTAGITHIDHRGRPAVRKVLSGRNLPMTLPQWRASGDPRHRNYWRRGRCVQVRPRVRQSSVPFIWVAMNHFCSPFSACAISSAVRLK